jgi:hypothetical protein
MTTIQFLLLIGTIYVAPHIPRNVAICLGAIFLICAALAGLKGQV